MFKKLTRSFESENKIMSYNYILNNYTLDESISMCKSWKNNYPKIVSMKSRSKESLVYSLVKPIEKEFIECVNTKSLRSVVKMINTLYSTKLNMNDIKPIFKRFGLVSKSKSEAMKQHISKNDNSFNLSKLSDEVKSKRSRKSIRSRIDSGYKPFSEMTDDDISRRRSKAVNTALKNGNHISQNTSLYSISIKGKEYKCSKAEMKVYRRFTRLLNKYYVREIKVSKYYDFPEFSYIADWVKKYDKFNDLPDIIEIKGSKSDFNIGYKGKDFSKNNYYKYKYCLEHGLSVLVVTYKYNGKFKFNRFYTVDDLDLFYK